MKIKIISGDATEVEMAVNNFIASDEVAELHDIKFTESYNSAVEFMNVTAYVMYFEEDECEEDSEEEETEEEDK